MKRKNKRKKKKQGLSKDKTKKEDRIKEGEKGRNKKR